MDCNEKKVQEMRNYTEHAFVAENLTKETLEEMGIQNCDTVIVCIGEKIDTSILTTLNVVNLGVTNVIAKALSQDQGAVLEKIGAINGAVIAQGDYDVAVRLWDSIETSHIMNVTIDESKPLRQKVRETYQSFVANFVKDGGTKVNGLKEILTSFLDEERVRSSPIEYGLITLEMDS